MFEAIAKAIAMPIDDVRILLCVLAHIPLAFVYRTIPYSTPTLIVCRKAFGAIIGLLSFVICYPLYGLLGILSLATAFYGVSLYCTDQKTTFWLSLLAFSGLCGANIYRLFVDSEGDKIGIDIVYMIVTPKIVYFFWHVFALISTGKSAEIPPFWDYFCYLFNFVGILTTPIFTPVEFECFVQQNRPEKSINWAEIGSTFLEVAVWIVVFLGIQSKVDIRLIERKEFTSLPILRQLLQIFIEGFYMRARFIIIWKLAYVQVVAVNLRQLDGDHDEYTKTVDSFIIATSCSPKLIIDNWNISIQRWLKRCFYLPVLEIFKLTPQRAGFVTLAVSAFWHGFFPTYYLAFFGFNYMVQTEKLVFKNPTLHRYFPAIHHRLVLDFNALLFKRLPTHRWLPVMKNLWWVYLLNFVVYNLVKLFSRASKKSPDLRTRKEAKSAPDSSPNSNRPEGVRKREGSESEAK